MLVYVCVYVCVCDRPPSPSHIVLLTTREAQEVVPSKGQEAGIISDVLLPSAARGKPSFLPRLSKKSGGSSRET
jgi:hypothetical protein